MRVIGYCKMVAVEEGCVRYTCGQGGSKMTNKQHQNLRLQSRAQGRIQSRT